MDRVLSERSRSTGRAGAAAGLGPAGVRIAGRAVAPRAFAARRSSWRGAPTRARRLALALAVPLALALPAPFAAAQGLVDPERAARIESVEIDVAGDDAVLASRLADRVRRALAAFPGDRYSAERVAASLALARREPGIAELGHEIGPGPTGGVVLRVRVVPAEAGAPARARGVLTDAGLADLPVLYDGGGTYVRAKLESLAMAYGNRDAWYGRPDLMVAGNPFVQGTPAGAGGSGWLEGFVHAGVYGLAPVSGSVHAYAGLSAIGSGSVGQELFTDRTRSHVGVEDAYVGLVGGSVSPAGNRLAWTVSAGRQRFGIGDGFLIANTATNGRDRAALQSNPRWAADMLALARVSYDGWRAEAFHLDPDELPAIDTRTRIEGVNVEGSPWAGLTGGLTGMRVPRSGYAYYTPTAVLGREGLRVLDARVRWQPALPGRDGPFLAAEAARQSSASFDMRAFAWTGEAGYVFASATWSPTISYRYARFSGDDPATTRFERWDPLLSGGNGETWVQGINHFKVFQNSNLVTHRVQARLRPGPRLELVPQLWVFHADSTSNLGGNPALSVLGSKDLGTEANLTVRYVVSRRTLLQGHVAATFAGRAVEDALGTSSGRWLSAMLFLRIAL
jgi:hypothetical protein